MARITSVAVLLVCAALTVNGVNGGLFDWFTAGRAKLEDDRKLPWFCRGKDCPDFKLEDKGEGYEVRRYEESAWVTYNTTGYKFEFAMGRAFTGLYRYFNGNNEDEEKMDLTTPYATAMVLKDTEGGAATERNYTIGLMVPHKYWKKGVPKPTLDTLEVVCNPETVFYTRSISGYATEATFLEERNKLRDSLKADDRKFNDEWFVAAVYDPPTKLTDRYNEVWIPKEKKDHKEKKHHHKEEEQERKVTAAA